MNLSEPKRHDASKQRFLKHATHRDEQGNLYLSEQDFVEAVAPPNENYEKVHRNSYAVLFGVADHSKQGRVSLNDWLAFDNLLEQPDAEFQIAFRVFDTEGAGYVNFKEFVNIYNANRSSNSLPFDWNSKWAALYLGESGQRHNMSYQQFSQMVSGLVGERIRQAFQHFDKKKTGFITPDEFEEIMKRTAQHKLSNSLLENLHTVTQRPNSISSKVSYATVRAFVNLVNHTEYVEKIARESSRDNHFTRKDFMENAARSARFLNFTPLEIDLLFHFANDGDSNDSASLEKFEQMFNPQWQDVYSRYHAAQQHKVAAAKNAASDPRSFLSEVFESVYNFTLGSVAGAFGATVVYPIDLVKTRMQNQRKAKPGQALLYKNSWDCFKKTVHNEGFRGLYSGLGPQLIGVAPEKAIKLTVNDLVRGIMTKPDGSLDLWAEIMAGGSAGACQVVFTNPLEIVKIRLQVQGEMARHEGVPKRSAVHIVRQLGLVGLYKGATACLLRDVPFSAIYFPTYAHLKKDYFNEGPGHPLKTWQLLVAGAVAGIPAAYLTTPFDVIKTRLQVESRKGMTQYNGLRHAASIIWHEEGFTAFFKGGPARILRSSPQFGCTLAAYEVLKRLLPFPGSGKNSEAGHSVRTADFAPEPPVKYLRSRNSLKVLLDIDENFGKPWAKKF
ncbi:Calcium-binding mitochondrial carrier protein Aralar1 [Wickerhamiella sorbophila]|uniref:Mitochondrial aspartate-glutamate transporter AGC1 n=1 Tax=Wickerhamiella sorbophila TaxID=45607 RepID=A0A2T0FHV6_9ASCO|nr:Calcium-binding mitochondrial carrier protein Aralar1 [Wickerhamiella sorbophila]PRT54581.1 Calcium-binding mitochondrial carrier protein Aralar1 [Wickerhamiella sorbophila]